MLLSRRVLLVTGLLTALATAGLVSFITLRKVDRNQPESNDSGLAAIQVSQEFTVIQTTTPDLTRYPMLAALDSSGRLFLCESTGRMPGVQERKDQPEYFIRVLEDDDGDGIYDRSRIFAEELSWPQGVAWYGDSLYVASAPDVLRFRDTNGDGLADDRQVILSGWNLSSNSATLHGPYVSPEGWLYVTDGRHGYRIQTREGSLLEGNASGVWRFRPDGRDLEMFSGGGFDNPVELIFLPSGEVLGTMTYFVDPEAGERDALLHWVEGGVYPKPHPSVKEDGLILTGDLMPVMTRFGRVAPSGLARYRSSTLGEEYQNNLFSAQFNTRRVLRHRLSRQGATFRTEDEIFLFSEDLHFHPTDVLEDADGSLLVIDTGGWYSCPLTGPGHPEAPGAVYRVVRKNSSGPVDSRGVEIDFETLPSDQRASYLQDSRPAVQDKAVESLVNDGESATTALTNVLRDSGRAEALNAEARARAVFALYRIGGEAARQEMRRAMTDPDPQVRVAAVRCLGLERDAGALEQLLEVVLLDESAAVRRQAATALGQIGNRRAVPALLKAADNVDDRFLEHAIIYSLIQLNEPTLLSKALRNRSAPIQKAALIALDQMKSDLLNAELISSALNGRHPDLVEAGLRIASNHPEWADQTARFVEEFLRDPETKLAYEAPLKQLLVSLCETGEIQDSIAKGLTAADSKQKRLLLQVMKECSVTEFPASWNRGIRELLKESKFRILAQVLQLIRFRGLDGFKQELENIARNTEVNPGVRTHALSALILTYPELTADDLDLLVGELAPTRKADRRQRAAAVLGSAQLEKGQLLYVTRQILPRSDPLVFAQLLEAYRGRSEEEVGQALVTALEQIPFALDGNRKEEVTELLSHYPFSVRQRAEALMEGSVRGHTNPVDRLLELEGRLGTGSVARGRQIFFGSKVGCSSCHTIGKEGGRIGPDLTSVGAIRSRYDILQSIVFPGASFVREFESRKIRTDREVWSGIIQQRDAKTLVLAVGANSTVRIPVSRILSIEDSVVSIMPEGLDQSLSTQELSDLMAFLESCR